MATLGVSTGGLPAAKYSRHFEQTHALLLACAVVTQRFDQTRQQRRPHHGQIGRQRIGQRHQSLGETPARQQIRRHEGQIHRLVIAACRQLLAQRQFVDARFRLDRQRQAPVGVCVGMLS
jgi:hypothetical protein